MGALSEQEFAKALRLSVLEGGAWACMVGLAETYFLATAVHLGADPLELGLTVALPLALGSLGPVSALFILKRRATRRGFTVASVVVQVMILFGLAALLATGRLDVWMLIGGICLYQMTGQAAGTAWSSWYGDLVPAPIRGRWFARRNRVVYLATCAGLVAGGAILHRIEPSGVAGTGSRVGLATLFGLAAVFRIVSAVLLDRSPEPRFSGLPARARVMTFARTDRGNQVLRILFLGAAFHFTVYWASPYFAPFLLEELRFSYLEYMIAALTVIVAKAVFTSGWGHFVDSRGAKPMYLLALLCVALVPVPWMWAGGLLGVLAAQSLSGASWSGYEVSYFSLLLEKSTRQTRPFVFAGQSIANGVMQLAGVLLAAHFLVPRIDSYREIFAMSVGGRLFITLCAPLVLLGIPRGSRKIWSTLEFRLFGLRTQGGFTMRPILGELETGEEPENPPPKSESSLQAVMQLHRRPPDHPQK